MFPFLFKFNCHRNNGDYVDFLPFFDAVAAVLAELVTVPDKLTDY